MMANTQIWLLKRRTQRIQHLHVNFFSYMSLSQLVYIDIIVTLLMSYIHFVGVSNTLLWLQMLFLFSTSFMSKTLKAYNFERYTEKYFAIKLYKRT